MIRFYWRPLVPGERDPELLWGSIFAVGGLLLAGWLWSGLPTPLCPLHALTGIPCPTCGMTRGLHCLLHGNPEAAFLFNPLIMIILGGLVLYLVYAAVVVSARLPRLRWEALSTRTRAFLRMLIVFFIAINWIYLVIREPIISALR